MPVGELLYLGFSSKNYGASGIVKPHKYREDDYDEDDEGDILEGEEEVDDFLLDYDQYVELSKVERFDVHHVPSGKRKKVLDRHVHIYEASQIRTTKLKTPVKYTSRQTLLGTSSLIQAEGTDHTSLVFGYNTGCFIWWSRLR